MCIYIYAHTFHLCMYVYNTYVCMYNIYTCINVIDFTYKSVVFIKSLIDFFLLKIT